MASKNRDQEALDYHSQGRPGKVAIRPTKPLSTQRDLALAYSPGVAEPCLEIRDNPEAIYDYTAKGNLVAVVSNGSAVLGLGNIGPEASKPVMEGKGVLFKRFADIDVFDIEVKSPDPDAFIEVVAALEPTFGGINLEDIRAPECFYIEETLRERMNIPVFHDDQHGTAIITAAAFVNALELVDKKIEDVRCVFSGAGAAAIACAQLFVELGVPHAQLIMCDSRGVIYTGREAGMNPYKARFAVETDLRTLEEAMVGADVFVGVSIGGAVSAEMVQSMSGRPIVMALANPDPEISYPDAKAARSDVIVATGRSDYPNQVNNVLGFPFLFRGALDTRATSINEAMKRAAVYALAELAREEVPEEVKRAYGAQELGFGDDYIIPKPFDTRALLRVAPAVAKAAIDSGVARINIDDWDAYRDRLERILGREREVIRRVIHKAARDPRRVVFPEGDHPKILQAARAICDNHVASPILLGPVDAIEALAGERHISLDGITLIEPRHDPRYEAYADAFWQRRQRRGVTRYEALRRMNNRNWFAAMMVEMGDADGMVSGITHTYPDTIRPALQIIGSRPGVTRVAGAHLMIYPNHLRLFADTTVNIQPTAEDLAEIALATAGVARSLDMEPHVALLSFSTYGVNRVEEANKVRRAVALLRERAPDLSVDGELQPDVALDRDLRESLYPFSTLRDDANVLIFPDLNSGTIGYKLLKDLDDITAVGPILIGLNRPVNVLDRDCSVSTILAMAAITVVQAQEGL